MEDANSSTSTLSTILSQITALRAETRATLERIDRNERATDDIKEQLESLIEAFKRTALTQTTSQSPTPVDPQSSASQQNREDFDQHRPFNTSGSRLVTDTGSKLRHRVEEFPEYSGGKTIAEDIHFWIATVESKTTSYTENFSEDDYRRIIHSRFVGQAKEMLQSFGMLFDACRTWADMKHFLRVNFSDPNYDILVETELNNKILLPTESLAAFWNMWIYLLNAVAQRRKLASGLRRQFMDGHLERVIGKLPTTIQTEVDIRFRRLSNITDPTDRLSRILLSEEIANFRYRRLYQEWLEFKSLPIFQYHQKHVYNNLGWLNQQLRLIGAPEIRAAPSRQFKPAESTGDFSRQTENPAPRRVIPAQSKRRDYKCVCGGAHRYADCPKESGQAKYRELQARMAKRAQPGVRFVANDNAIYILEDGDEDDDDLLHIAKLEDDSETEDFQAAGH